MKKKCCNKCWHINIAFPTSQNYCADRECECHTPNSQINMKKEIRENILTDITKEELEHLKEKYGVVTVPTPNTRRSWEEEFDNYWFEGYNGENTQGQEKFGEYIKSFIRSLLSQDRKELCEKIGKHPSTCGVCLKKGVNIYGECRCSYEDKNLLKRREVLEIINNHQ